MDFNPFDGKGNPLAAIGTDAAMLALLALSAKHGIKYGSNVKDITKHAMNKENMGFRELARNVRGADYRYNGQWVSDILRHPEGAKRLIVNNDSIVPIDPEILSKPTFIKAASRKSKKQGISSEFSQQPHNVGPKGELTDKGNQVEDFVRTQEGAKFAEPSTNFPDTNEQPRSIHITRNYPGETAPQRALNYIVKNNDPNENLVFPGRNINPGFNIDELPALSTQANDAFMHNSIDAPFAKMYRERALDKRGAFSKEANAEYDTKLKELAASRPEVVNAIRKVMNDFNIPESEFPNVLGTFVQNTYKASGDLSMDRLIKNLMERGVIKPEKIFTEGGNYVSPDAAAQMFNRTQKILEGEASVTGNKMPTLYRNLAGIEDTSVLDTTDFLKGYNIKNIMDNLLGDAKIKDANKSRYAGRLADIAMQNGLHYDTLIKQINAALSKRDYINKHLNRFDKSISGKQMMIRGRKAI